MCELLVKAIDAIHPDPVINLAGCYKIGDVVTVQADNFEWASGELDANVFSIVKMVGIAVDDMLYMLSSNKEPIPNTATLKIPALRKLAHNTDRAVTNRKRYSINLETKQITDKAR